MPVTAQQLLQILPNAGQVAGVFAPVLNTAMNRYQIVGTQRVVLEYPHRIQFLGQHPSDMGLTQ